MSNAVIGNRIPEFALDYGVLSNVYNIRTAAATGTCFVFENKGKACFVSAAHVLKGVCVGEAVLLGRGDDWEPHIVTEIARHPGTPDVDVCCFTIENPPVLHKSHAVDVDESHLFPGEEVKFVGFPHGLSITAFDASDYRHGLVRTAFLSGVIDEPGYRVWIFDGFNNPGYSGGPVFKYLGDNKITWCGLVTGFRHEKAELGQLYKKVGEEFEEVADHYVKRLNSGMIYAFGRAEIRFTAELLRTPYEITPE